MQLTSTQRKAIDQYYMELEAYHDHKVTHETAVRSAFQYLLATFAKAANWTLIPEQILDTVSVETVRLVEELAREVTQEDWLGETVE